MGYQTRLLSVMRMLFEVANTFSLPDVDIVVEQFDW